MGLEPIWGVGHHTSGEAKQTEETESSLRFAYLHISFQTPLWNWIHEPAICRGEISMKSRGKKIMRMNLWNDALISFLSLRLAELLLKYTSSRISSSASPS